MGELVELRPEVAQVHEPLRPLREARAHLVQTTDDAAALMRWLGERGREEIGFDTETTGLSKFADRPRLVQVGDAMDGWAIPFERWGGVVEDLVHRYQGRYVMHNAPFDWSMMHQAGIEIPTWQIDDTRIMAHVLSSTGPLALKTLAQKEVDPGAAAAQDALNAGIGGHGGWSWANVPITYEPYWVYGALDPILTYRLARALRPRMEADAPLSYQLEMAVLWVCVRMELRGTKLDREYTRDLATKLRTYLGELEAWTKQYYGVRPGSYDVAERLRRDGVELTVRTPGGQWCLDKYVLAELEHPLAQATLTYRQTQKTVSTYLDNYLRMSERDGRIHASINTVGGTAKNPFESGGTRGVRTGRMSMDDPNLQNVPIRTSAGKRIRNCFTAEDEAHTWVKYDADQIEMRIFAHLADDPGLIAAFREAQQTGVDMFTLACRQIFQEPEINRDDLRRQHTKNGFYAILYGAGTEQFAKTAGIFHPRSRQPDLGAAAAFLQSLHGRYPGIRELQRKIEGSAAQRKLETGTAYVRSPLTHRKHTADDGREFALMNYMVQGAAGEVLKMKLVEADHAGLGEFMLFPVHDEIDLNVPTDQLGDVLHTLDEVMNDDTLLTVPLTWTAGYGQRWGDCS